MDDTPPSSSSSPFPPHPLPIPEDTVIYSIYPDLPSSLPPSSLLSHLHSLHLQILSLLPSLLPPNHIWHHSPFHLSPSLSPLPRLHGRTHFSSNLDDEWLIVSLLLSLSRSLPSLSIQISDSDGEFLLIESAYHLPRWLSPARAANRVFLRSGLVHIIPKSLSPNPPSLSSALSLLSDSTIAPAAVQSAIRARISTITPTHLAMARVPVAIAQILTHEPSLISLAVNAFYDRDVDSMKLAAKMEKFPAGETALTPVRMTRAMYAQLVRQRFAAPKGYVMPAAGEKGFAEAELGMKIAVGFEMMYGMRRREGEEGKGETWEVFLRSLESSGCFDGVMKGSNEHCRIVDGAMEYYKKTSVFSQTRYL